MSLRYDVRKYHSNHQIPIPYYLKKYTFLCIKTTQYYVIYQYYFKYIHSRTGVA